MDAVVVAGGLGSRLLPLTEHQPKHLLPVGGVPFVAHQLAKLAACGVRRVVLATSYHANLFEPVLGDGRAWGVDLVYVREPDPLGTAGAIRNAADELSGRPGDPVVVLNGDILSGHDLGAQLDEHRRCKADVTLHLVEVPDARAYGCVPTDQAGKVTAFVEKSPHPVSRQVNAGCYVFTRRIIDEIPAGRMVSVERETFPELLAVGRAVRGWLDRAYWLDVGTPAALCRASADLVRGAVASPAYPHPPAGAWVSPGAQVEATAVISGGSAVGPGARVGGSAVVTGSVICPGASIGAGSTVIDAVVGPGAVIGPDVVLRGCAIGDGAVIGARCELLQGVRVRCGAELAAGAVRFSPR